MKLTNEQLKQIIKEELNNVLQEWNPLMALPFMGRKNKEEPEPQRKGLGRPRNAPIKGPKPPPPMKQHPDTPKLPASSIKVDLQSAYEKLKNAAADTEVQVGSSAGTDVYDLMSDLGIPDSAFDDLYVDDFISHDEESGRVEFRK